LAEKAILKQRLADIERIVCERKERKNGKRTLEVLEDLKNVKRMRISIRTSGDIEGRGIKRRPFWRLKVLQRRLKRMKK